MAKDDWKLGVGVAAGAGIAGLIACGIYAWKKSEWEKERQQFHYKIRTLEGEVLSQSQYIRRLETRLEQMQTSYLQRMDTITEEANGLLTEVEEIRRQVRQGTEFFNQLTNIAARARRLQELVDRRLFVTS